MQVAISFPNESIAQKVLWVLEHFKSDGVEIVELEDTNQEILKNFQEGIEELKLIKKGILEAKPVEELLSEL